MRRVGPRARPCHEHWAVDRLDRLHRERVDDLDVLGVGQRLGVEDLHHRIDQVGGRHARLNHALAFGDRTRQHRGSGALFGRQVGVAARFGQAVVLAHDRAAGDLHVEVQIEDHLLHNGELLGVLLAEVGVVGQHDVEELGEHRADAAEVGRARQAVHALGEQAHVDVGLMVLVHLGRFGMEDQIGPHLLRERAVVLEVARVGVEVLVGRELNGIQKDRNDHLIVVLARLLDEARVSFVQVAHRGNEPDGLAFPLPRARDLLGLFNRVGDLHC